MDRYSDQNEFEVATFLELGIALLENNHLYLLEREFLETSKARARAADNFRWLEGTSFVVNVELIALRSGNLLLNKKFKFQLTLEPELSFTEIIETA